MAREESKHEKISITSSHLCTKDDDVSLETILNLEYNLELKSEEEYAKINPTDPYDIDECPNWQERPFSDTKEYYAICVTEHIYFAYRTYISFIQKSFNAQYIKVDCNLFTPEFIGDVLFKYFHIIKLSNDEKKSCVKSAIEIFNTDFSEILSKSGDEKALEIFNADMKHLNASYESYVKST